MERACLAPTSLLPGPWFRRCSNGVRFAQLLITTIPTHRNTRKPPLPTPWGCPASSVGLQRRRKNHIFANPSPPAPDRNYFAAQSGEPLSLRSWSC